MSANDFKLVDKLDSRKSELLKLTVQRHISTAEPVGSAWLSEKMECSSATIRNEMSALESAGYLAQPHTSAGRIPTELGYKYYIQNFLEKKRPAPEAVQALREAEGLRGLAKALAEQAQETALVGFGPRNVYYTGISNLFSKPEFRMAAYVTTMSKVLDHLDEVMEQVFHEVDDDVQILVGTDNPFGTGCSVLITKVPGGVIALLGPIRMDYDHCFGLLEEAVKILNTTAISEPEPVEGIREHTPSNDGAEKEPTI